MKRAVMRSFHYEIQSKTCLPCFEKNRKPKLLLGKAMQMQLEEHKQKSNLSTLCDFKQKDNKIKINLAR